MIGKRLENGGKINYSHAETFKIVELFDNASEIASEKIVGVIVAVGTRHLGVFVPVVVQTILSLRNDSLGFSESVDKYVVDNIAFCVIRRFILGIIHG